MIMKKVTKCHFSLFQNRISPIFGWYQQPICLTFGWCRQLICPIFYWYRQPIFTTFQWYRQLLTSWPVGKNNLAGEQLSVPQKCRKNWLAVLVKNRES